MEYKSQNDRDLEMLADTGLTDPAEILEAVEEFFNTQGLSQGMTLVEFYEFIHS